MEETCEFFIQGQQRYVAVVEIDRLFLHYKIHLTRAKLFPFHVQTCCSMQRVQVQEQVTRTSNWKKTENSPSRSRQQCTQDLLLPPHFVVKIVFVKKC